MVVAGMVAAIGAAAVGV
jgi:hypothetical protein